MTAIIFNLTANDNLVKNIAEVLEIEQVEVIFRHFPDDETYIRIDFPVQDHDVIVVCSLSYPDQKILPLLYFAETVKSLGARSVGLVAPYLAYMRQDSSFQAGEGVTSNYFAKLLSQYFSWLITVDPHLHRYHSLSEIYTIPTMALHVAELFAVWIKANVAKPLLIGPDVESEKWIKQAAKSISTPYVILNKKRFGDRDVAIDLPNLLEYQDYIPVIIDDIISTGKTMLKIVEQLQSQNKQSPILLGIHALFVEDAYEELMAAGVNKIVTTNTISHITNQIDISHLLADGIHDFMKG